MAEEEIHQPRSGSSGHQIAGDMVGGDKVAGDKFEGDNVEGDKITVVVGSPEQAGAFVASLRWSWPTAWDFRSYREERRKDFVGRSWLFADVRAWALNPDPQAPQALLIGADYGVGKTAFLAELLAIDAAGLPVAAHHFCTSEQKETLKPARFVRNLAVQLANALPAFRQALEAEQAKETRQWLDEAERDPSRAFDQAILAPLLKIDPPSTAMLWVVDALDEAQEVWAGGSPITQLTIVQLLARYASRLPHWIKVLATSRRRPDVLNPLRQAFSLQELDAEEGRNLEDLSTYALERCRRSPLTERLRQAGLSAEEVARFLSGQEQSSGKFLYVVRVLNDLASGQLPLHNRKDLEQLPPGMDGFYRDTFERRFPSEESYAPVRDILGVLCEQREPLGRKELAAILSDSGQAIAKREILEWLKPMHDLLRLVSRTEQINGKPHQIVLHAFDHVSLPQWLSEADEWGYGRGGRFMVDRTAAAELIHRWALTQVTCKQAHTWPYLVRHLADHLTEEERPAVIAGLLREFTWLDARLRQEGINVLLGDFDLSNYESQKLPPEMGRLERALSQAAHVLGHEDGWKGQEQLASQLLARISLDAESKSLLAQSKEWLLNSGSALPRLASLSSHHALIRTIQVGEAGTDVNALTVLADGSLASGSSENIIQLWNPSKGTCTDPLKGHNAPITSLLTHSERCIISGSIDCTIRVWDLSSGKCIHILDNHMKAVTCLALVDSSCLASGSVDGSISLWNLKTLTRTDVVKHHLDRVTSLAALNDGILASGSYDKSILLWNIKNGRFDDSLPRRFHEDEHWISSLAGLVDGGLISGSSKGTICIWNSLDQAYPKRLIGHHGNVMDLLPLNDNLLVSAGGDGRILLWERDNQKYTNDLQEHLREVNAIKSLPNGQLVSCSSDSTIRLWKLPEATESKMPERHNETILFLKPYSDSVLVSLSVDLTVRYWDIASCQCISVVEDSQTWLDLYTKLQLSTGHNPVYSQSLFSSNLVQSPGSGGCFHWGSKGDWSNYLPLEITMGRSISIVSQSVVCLAENTSLDFAPRVIFVADAEITCITWVLSSQLLVTGDSSGRLHWLEMPPPQNTADSKHRPRS